MPSHRCGSSSYVSVRERPNGTFYTEIHAGGTCLELGTYETVHEAARAFDAAA
jgi:hypothetical protein